MTKTIPLKFEIVATIFFIIVSCFFVSFRPEVTEYWWATMTLKQISYLLLFSIIITSEFVLVKKSKPYVSTILKNKTIIFIARILIFAAYIVVFYLFEVIPEFTLRLFPFYFIMIINFTVCFGCTLVCLFQLPE